MVASSDIDWSDPAAPRSRAYGDVYFSLEDGLAESRAVFLAGCGLPEAWRDRRTFTVAELGFGTGLNIAALLTLWRETAPPDARLSIFSIEAHPLSAGEAARALAAWPEIVPAAEALTRAWPATTPGFHRRDLPEWRATLDLAIGDAAWALEQWSGRADAWFLDGFAPSTNPAMWSDVVFDGVGKRSAPGARVATFTVAGAVRRGLAERGFVVDKRPGHGRKRERLEARLPGIVSEPAEGDVLVIGAGVAGAAVARALSAQGLRPVVIAPEDEVGMASDFRAALVTPRFDLGDAAVAALNAQALERAGALYDAAPDAVLERGVVRLEGKPRDEERFDRIAAQSLWSDGELQRCDAAAMTAALREPVAMGGLTLRSALAVRPQAIRRSWLGDAQRIAAEVARLERRSDRWSALDVHGGLIAEAAQVVIAAGWGSAALSPDLALRPSRGQVSWASGGGPIPPVTWGGYAVPVDGGLLFGATHDRGRTDVEADPADDRRNLDALTRALPEAAGRLDSSRIEGRGAVRATTADHLPVCGQAAPGLWVLGGLGSRGFLMAPLLGEHLAASIAGAPSPLPCALSARLDPGRFIVHTAEP
ncbi:tRNA (5-methylaminomethyl-2-thiouridine)(34)-methyltransferase MnmD [Brevundimonas lutea]|uniref:tRNA (5-methylaminomethyl-2-thiouridine)(34)-methyltransferase MnmD n=1 Tax=Brevundimonas lutea TaxID=2293980 RepID=UPI000F0410AB|nr:tRNA (5-methylaminomethyl-2-thiouridine)(34)-methyltransferase MnmD [Brevundimonas lutea]